MYDTLTIYSITQNSLFIVMNVQSLRTGGLKYLVKLRTEKNSFDDGESVYPNSSYWVVERSTTTTPN